MGGGGGDQNNMYNVGVPKTAALRREKKKTDAGKGGGGDQNNMYNVGVPKTATLRREKKSPGTASTTPAAMMGSESEASEINTSEDEDEIAANGSQRLAKPGELSQGTPRKQVKLLQVYGSSDEDDGDPHG